MNFLKTFIKAYLHIQLFFLKASGQGSFGPEQAKYINGNITTNGNFLKKSLLKHHVKQYHEASCSVASIVSAVNAIKDYENTLSSPPISQKEILEKVRTANWKERISSNGHKGKRGLPLNTLADIVQSSLESYGINYRQIETIQATTQPEIARKIKLELKIRLKEFEEKGNCLIIAHFNQGVYVKALHIPHISPVGGYNIKTNKVTVLDVDPLQENPYQISFDRFYDGISSNYNHVFSPFGYGSGGYIYVKLHEPKQS